MPTQSADGGHPDSMPTYPETLDYLYSFTDYERHRPDRYSPEAFDLGRVRALLKSLGNPQNAYPSLHVAGTKGKGSTSALCANSLVRAGYRTGFYSSPHLQDFRERIRVDGLPISEDEVVETVEALKPAAESVPGITAFELITATAFLCFARRQVDFVVLEVGLGGRLDPTNVVRPLASVITSISYDHMHLLGNTLTEIAGEKAGIIKVGVPVISAPQTPEALEVIERVAAERCAPLRLVGRDWLYTIERHTLFGQTVSVWPAGNGGATRLTLPLLGAHQAQNAAVAYAALAELRRVGLALPAEAVMAGFAEVDWPGRFEILSRQSPTFVVDCAHNGDSAKRLVEALDDYFPGRPVVLLFGASADKDIGAMFAHLLPRVDRVVMTQAIHSRAVDPEELAAQAAAYGRWAEAIAPVSAAVARAVQLAGPEDVVLATGSLFVVSEVRAAWLEELPAPATRQGGGTSEMDRPGPAVKLETDAQQGNT